tara:strand:- start:3934 stop:4947 length:1014 start_codon:yes stop_codon:yes gene_type:complete
MCIQLFEKVCLFNNNKTIIYGQYKQKFNKIDIIFNTNKTTNIKFNLVFCENSNDFYIDINEKITYIAKISFIENEIIAVKKDINLFFPFEKCDLSLNSSSAIISTMCKDYSSRLEEWIEYNLNLGFSGIVIFDNDKNKNNPINEHNLNLGFSGIFDNDKNNPISDICKKYKGKVWCVEFPYTPFKGDDWNNIQRISLHIGVNAFQTKCSKIALIDADEFIYVSNYPNINKFFSQYKGKTITMKSNILTNKNNNDIIKNNILDLCLYVGENKYSKTIIDTSVLNSLEFIITPHSHRTEISLDKNEIIHYHCWVNSRYKYNENMVELKVLKDMKKKYDN